ncbi:MAG: ribonuclease HI [Patescibacteria group bacterium]
MIIFTDGSSRGNPGRGGWGAIIFGNDNVTELGGNESNTTNNRMELMAVISALEFAKEKEIVVYTDSAYIVSGITRWIAGWKRNNWKTSTKDDVLNRDLWERLDNATAKRIIDWRLVKGHSGNPGNERCDVIATTFADNDPTSLYNGPKENYNINPSVDNSLSTTQKPKNKGKGYSYVSSVDGVIQVHRTWEECKKRVNGTSGAKFKKSFSPENEEEIINEFTR